jgi:hypothetical protein
MFASERFEEHIYTLKRKLSVDEREKNGQKTGEGTVKSTWMWITSLTALICHVM